MQNIVDFIPNRLRIETYVKGNQVALSVAPIESFYFGKSTAPLALESHDEVPCFFVSEDGYFGAIKVSFPEALDGKIEKLLGQALSEQGVSGESLHVIMGPTLTFSHNPVSEEEYHRIAQDYRAACKATSGVYYVDTPLLCLMQFRALGVKMENIRIGDYDTFENPSLLYSLARGEEEENVTLATLL